MLMELADEILRSIIGILRYQSLKVVVYSDIVVNNT